MLWFPRSFLKRKWNARAHSVRAHLQHFQSQQSYRAHALSSVAKSSLSQLNMLLSGEPRLSVRGVENPNIKNCALKCATPRTSQHTHTHTHTHARTRTHTHTEAHTHIHTPEHPSELASWRLKKPSRHMSQLPPAFTFALQLVQTPWKGREIETQKRSKQGLEERTVGYGKW